MPQSEPAHPRVKREEMSIDQVQRWVVSVLIFAISAFPTGGLIAVSHAVLGQGRRGAAIALLVMAGVVGVICVVVIRFIHKRSPFTPLLILGVLPAAIAAYFVL